MISSASCVLLLTYSTTLHCSVCLAGKRVIKWVMAKLFLQLAQMRSDGAFVFLCSSTRAACRCWSNIISCLVLCTASPHLALGRPLKTVTRIFRSNRHLTLSWRQNLEHIFTNSHYLFYLLHTWYYYQVSLSRPTLTRRMKCAMFENKYSITPQSPLVHGNYGTSLTITIQ